MLLVAAHVVLAVVLPSQPIVTGARIHARRSPPIAAAAEGQLFELKLPLGAAGTANLRFRGQLPSSEAVVVRYKLPFGLNVENVDGRALCTKDGPGGERVGDILRYTTNWSMGLPRGDGLLSTAASFGGAIGWQIGLFDVNKAKSWDEVVEALVSNTQDRTDIITLVFERPK